MMLKVLPLTALTALVLGLAGGAAHADRHHGDRRGPVIVRDHREWRGGGYREPRGWHRPSRVVHVEPRYERVVRRPIYVSRPVIRHRYYDYRVRPQLIVENYNSMPGYYWVAGQWSWTGYEWTWQPGHYEPDAQYGDADCDHDDRY